MKPKLILIRIFVLALLAGHPQFSRAQTAPAASTRAGDPAGKSEEIIELSPFIVTTGLDRGYTATSAVAGTRIATSLKESSAPIGILTKEFLEDISATNIAQAAEWGANVYLLADKGPEADYWTQNYLPNVFTRGIAGSSWSIARNYFISYVPIDVSTTERIEMSRGPNASLYGDGPLGGLVNSNSKRARLDRKFTTIGMRTDSEGSMRGTFDANVAAGGKFAVRVNGMAEDARTWRRGERNYNRSLLLSGTWRINRDTEFRGEILRDRRKGSQAASVFGDSTSRWDRVTALTGPLAAAPAKETGVGLFTANTPTGADYWVFESGRPNVGPVNWKGFGRSLGTGLAIFPEASLNAAFRPDLPTAPILPSRSFTYNNVHDPAYDKDTTLFGAYLQHRFFGKLDVEGAYQYVTPQTSLLGTSRLFGSGFAIDTNANRPTATGGLEPNPHFGEVFTDVESNRYRTRNWVNDGRILAAYPVKWGIMEQRIVAMAGLRRDYYDNTFYRAIRINNPNSAVNFIGNSNNFIRVRRYASEGDTRFGWPMLGGAGDSGSLEIRDARQSSSKQLQYTTYGQVAIAGRYWDGKLASTFGWRRDELQLDGTQGRPGSPGGGATVYPASGQYIWSSEINPLFPGKFALDSITAGAVYFPTRAVAIFANYSEGFSLIGVRPRLNGDTMPPPSNEGNDIGLKLELFGGRISGSVSHYEMQRIGADPGAANLAGNFRAIWSNMVTGFTDAGNTAAAEAAQSARDALPGSVFDSRKTKGSGWELDLTANLTENWRAILNYGRPKNTLTDSSPDTIAYLAAHRAEWTAAANTLPPTQSTPINSQLLTIDTRLAQEADGRSVGGTPDYTANFFTRYRIPSGNLKGLFFGGGVRVLGPRLIGVPQVFVATSATAGSFKVPNLLGTLKSRRVETLSALVGYEFRVWKRDVKMQLNIDNLLDDDKVVISNYAAYTVPAAPSVTTPIKGYQVPSGFYYQKPRLYTLTISATF